MPTISMSGTGWTTKPSIAFAACSAALRPEDAYDVSSLAPQVFRNSETPS
jgi:hypothetical protein